MRDKLFSTPVTLVNECGQVTELATLAQAHSFLTTIETRDRGTAYLEARRMCEAAASGYATTQQARHAVIGFALEAGLCGPETAVLSRPIVQSFAGFAA